MCCRQEHDRRCPGSVSVSQIQGRAKQKAYLKLGHTESIYSNTAHTTAATTKIPTRAAGVATGVGEGRTSAVQGD